MKKTNLIDQIKDLRSEQKILAFRIEEIENLREKIMHPSGIDYSKDPVKSSPQDQLAKSIAELVDKQIELARMMVNRQETLDEFMDELNNLKPEERDIMFSRIRGLSYSKIAEDIYISKTTAWRTVKRIEEEYGQRIQR